MSTMTYIRRSVIVVVSCIVWWMAAAAPAAAVSSTEGAVVNTAITYTYEIMRRDLQELAKRYPDAISYTILAQTEYGRNIYAVRLGSGGTTIMINASHHAREWITTVLVMKMLEEYAKAYHENTNYLGYDVRNLLKDVSIWFVPMVNPDGVTLQQRGLEAFPRQVWDKLIRMNEGSRDFTRWKANASGIDLNRQYPADWENIQWNVGYPSYKNHKGTRPLQTVETRALVQFTYRIDPEIAVAYHSSGEILYWYFHNKSEHMDRDLELTRKLSEMTGYKPVDPTPNPSGGGYTDWFIQEFGRPGFTPELGKYVEERHVPLSAFPDIWRQNREVGLFLAEQAYLLRMERQPPFEVEETLHLFRETAVYEQPSHRSGEAGRLNAGTVRSVRKHADWYLIETGLETDPENPETSAAPLPEHDQPPLTENAKEAAVEEGAGRPEKKTEAKEDSVIEAGRAAMARSERAADAPAEDGSARSGPETGVRQSSGQAGDVSGDHASDQGAPSNIRADSAPTNSEPALGMPSNNESMLDMAEKPEPDRNMPKNSEFDDGMPNNRVPKNSESDVGVPNNREQTNRAPITNESDDGMPTNGESNGDIAEIDRNGDVRETPATRNGAAHDTEAGVPAGAYWIHESEVLAGAIEDIDWKLTLFEKTPIYDAPVARRYREGALAPQTVQAVRRHGDWFEIRTWLGGKWIRPQRYHVGEIVDISAAIRLNEKTSVYDLPFADLPPAGSLAPQTVQATARIGDWYRIRTWLGEKWIHLPSDKMSAVPDV